MYSLHLWEVYQYQFHCLYSENKPEKRIKMNTLFIIGSFVFIGVWMWIGCELLNAPTYDENEMPIEEKDKIN